MPKATAPGSVFLFGEHAVVYGYPALVASIDRTIEVRADLNRKNVLSITSDLGSLTTPLSAPPSGGKFRYVVEAVRQVLDYIGEKEGVDLEIKSQLPAASGLGTSSAVSVATIAAVSRAMGAKLSKEEIIRLSQKTELAIQGLASRAGVSAAALGGFLLIEGRKIKKIVGQKVRGIVGWSGIPSQTAELVKQVREMKEKNPEMVGLIFDFIGEIAKQGVRALKMGHQKRLGLLMNINHCLLSALKIVPSKVERMVAVSRHAGAYGAKITGAGGGGCILVLPGNKEKEVLEALREVSVKVFPVELGGEGLRWT
jgi:mevalonate kinase